MRWCTVSSGFDLALVFVFIVFPVQFYTASVSNIVRRGAVFNRTDYYELTKRKPQNPAELLAFCQFDLCPPPAIEMMVLAIPADFLPSKPDPCPIRVDCVQSDVCEGWSAAVCRYFANQTEDAYLCSCDPLRPDKNTNFRCNYAQDRIGYCEQWQIK